MMFFSMLAALALEHYRPLTRPLAHFQYFARYAAFLRERLDGGESFHGAIAWAAAVLPLVFTVWLVASWLSGLNVLLGWAWGVGVLYLTMGFKYYSLAAEDIAAHLRAGRLEEARRALEAWRGGDADEFEVRGIASVTIEQLFAHSHRQTFGVLFWFVLLGPAGAVLFRLSSIVSLRWREASPRFAGQVARIFHVINWLPLRLTALTYAVAGNFEDAFYCWRTQSSGWPDGEEGVAIAAGAGAMGVKLGQPLRLGGAWQARGEIGLGAEPDADQIDSANSMIWRGLAVWLVLALLFMVAGWAA